MIDLGDNWYILLFVVVVVFLGAIYAVVFKMGIKGNKSKQMPPNPFDDEDDVTENEIISMVNESHEQGNILSSEAEMINNIFEMEEKDAKDIMTHRTNICGINAMDTLNEVYDFILNQSYSRFPVYEESIDNILGILHIRDLMVYYKNPENANVPIKDLRGLIRNVSFIPETRDINTLFKKMQSNKEHMVIVIDEYGQTAGIVAMEDILEEIVGNIEDEYDNEAPLIITNDDGTYTVDGMTQIEDVFKVLGILDVEEEEEFDTLNGFLIASLDHIPEEEEEKDLSVEFGGFIFQVTEIENKIIKKVNIRRVL